MRRASFILLIIYFSTFCAFVQAQTKVRFFSGSLTSVKQKARDEGKLYFIAFHASWCAPCALMDETTFNDDQLARYLEKTYVPFKVDVEEFDGYSLKQQYNIKTLPTFLIFNSQGQMVARYEESMGTTRFLREMQKHDTPNNRAKKSALVPNVNNTSGEIKPKPMPTTPPVPVPKVEPTKKAPPVVKPPVRTSVATPPRPTIAKPQTATKASAPTKIIPKTAPTSASQGITSPKPPAPTATKLPTNFGEGLYEFSAKKKENKGFSVQTGVFYQFAFLLKEVTRLQNIFANETVLVYVQPLEGKPEPMYKVMLGSFPTNVQAEAFRKKLSTSGISGVVKNLALLQ